MGIGAAAALGARIVLGWRGAPERSTPGRVAALAAALLLPILAHHAVSPPFDDESWRLVAAQSYWSDLDLDLSNQYRDETWRAFRDDGPSFFTDHARDSARALAADPGTYYPLHAFGYPVVIAPFLALGAPFGVWTARSLAALPAVAAAALLAGLLLRVLRAEGLGGRGAVDGVLLFAATAPFGFFGVHLWPEWTAALAGLWCFDRLRRPAGTPLEAAAVGAAAVAPSLLHFRYAFLALPLGLWAIGAYARRPRALAAWAAAGLATGLCTVAIFAVRQDAHTWRIFEAAGLVYPTTRGQAFFDAAPLLDPGTLVRRLLLPPLGIVPYAPWVLLALRPPRGRPVLPVLGCLSVLYATILLSNFESGPIGRYWVAGLPFLLLLAARAEGLDHRPTRWLAAWGAAKAAVMLLLPVACHDAKFAADVAADLPPVLAPVVFLVLG